MDTDSSIADIEPPAAAGPNGDKNEQRGWWSRVEGQRLAGAWALCTMLGALAISLSREVTVRRLVIPVGIMIAYAWFGYRNAIRADTVVRRTTRIGQLADSLYFLGFLWTLWALIDSFVFKQLTQSEAVFRTFGYALVTTATGMFLRLLFLHFKYWAEDQRDVAHRELENQVERFSAAVGAAVKTIGEMADGINRLRQERERDLKEVAAAARDSAKAAASAAVAALAETVQDVAVRIGTNSRQLDGDLLRLGAAVTGATDSVNATATSLNASANALSAAVLRSQAAMQAGAESMARALQTSTSSIEANARRYIEVIDAVNRALLQDIKDLGARTDALSATVQGVASGVGEVEEAVHDVALRIEKVRVSPSVVEDAVSRKLTGIFAELERSAANLRESSDRLAISLKQMSGPVARGSKGSLRRWFDWLLGR